MAAEPPLSNVDGSGAPAGSSDVVGPPGRDVEPAKGVAPTASAPLALATGTGVDGCTPVDAVGLAVGTPAGGVAPAVVVGPPLGRIVGVAAGDVDGCGVGVGVDDGGGVNSFANVAVTDASLVPSATLQIVALPVQAPDHVRP
jgi:hypothetical protein